MDRKFSKKDSRKPKPRIKASEKQMQAEDRAGKQLLDSDDKPTTGQKPLSKRELPLEKKVEQETQKRQSLINEYNKLTFAVKQKEMKLQALKESLSTKTQAIAYDGDAPNKQRIRQLENNLDKMKMKIQKATEIQIAYQHICERLQQEVRDLDMVLENKACALANGQAEVDKATKQLQYAEAAAGSTLDRMVQMEKEKLEKKRQMDMELCELSAAEKEQKRQMEKLGRPSPTGSSRLEEQKIEEEEEDEEAHSSPVTDMCDAAQCDMRLVEDMDFLKEALGCADVQELVNKVVSQQATKEQLLFEVSQNEEACRQDAEALAQLKIQFTQLKFGAKPAATRCDQLTGKLLSLSEEECRANGLRAKLNQSQDLLDDVEQGVNNLYFRMSCVPVEGLSSAPITESMDKMRDISARLPTLLQLASQHKPVTSSLDQDMVFSAIEQLNSAQPRNVKILSSPAESPQLSEDEEECCPNREEIKRNSIRLIESQQNKKLLRKAKRK